MSRVAYLFLLLILIPGRSLAQTDCTIGAYGNAEGSPHAWFPNSWLGGGLYEFDVYYVLRVEDFVRGVAWSRTVHSESYPYEVELLGATQYYDPLEQFLEVTDSGFRMGLGDCHSGFGGTSIMVLKETLLLAFSSAGSKQSPTGPYIGIQIEANVLEDPEYTIYADCSHNATKKRCSLGGYFETVKVGDGQSWGAMKATYY